MGTHVYAWLAASTRVWRITELEEAGLNRRTVAYLVQRSELVRLQVNAYVSAQYLNELSTEERAFLRLRAHAHASRSATDPAYSHTSAARLHGVSMWDVDGRIHLTQDFAGSSRQHTKDVVRHKAPLLPRDLVTIQNYRATSLARTVVDCPRLLSIRQGLVIADHALRLGARRADLQEALDRQATFKGVQKARQVVANASPLSESPGETLTAHLLSAMPVPFPEQQLVVYTRLGEHRLDFAWRTEKIALEFDGKTKYFNYAATSEVLFRERQREKALMEDGWAIIRLEWRDLFEEERTRARILKTWWSRTKRAA